MFRTRFDQILKFANINNYYILVWKHVSYIFVDFYLKYLQNM